MYTQPSIHHDLTIELTYLSHMCSSQGTGAKSLSFQRSLQKQEQRAFPALASSSAGQI
jgi:hypothetical protein